jgi:hypothetical protein
VTRFRTVRARNKTLHGAVVAPQLQMDE